jgi:hypothetical protein
MSEMLINPRHAQPGTRQNDMKLGQLDIRMQKLEKSNQQLRARLDALEAKPVTLNEYLDQSAPQPVKRGPGRPPKAEAA